MLTIDVIHHRSSRLTIFLKIDDSHECIFFHQSVFSKVYYSESINKKGVSILVEALDQPAHRNALKFSGSIIMALYTKELPNATLHLEVLCK